MKMGAALCEYCRYVACETAAWMEGENLFLRRAVSKSFSNRDRESADRSCDNRVRRMVPPTPIVDAPQYSLAVYFALVCPSGAVAGSSVREEDCIFLCSVDCHRLRPMTTAIPALQICPHTRWPGIGHRGGTCNDHERPGRIFKPPPRSTHVPGKTVRLSQLRGGNPPWLSP